MLVTAAVFQSAIEPYVFVAVTGSVTHAVAAAAMFVLVMDVSAATCAGRKRSSARPARRCDRIARAHLHTSDTTRCNADVLQLVRVAPWCNVRRQVATLMDATRSCYKIARRKTGSAYNIAPCCVDVILSGNPWQPIILRATYNACIQPIAPNNAQMPCGQRRAIKVTCRTSMLRPCNTEPPLRDAFRTARRWQH
jgi:hypothetical protein